MHTVGLKEAREHLGDLVKAAEHGDTIVITSRGRKIARLVPPERKRNGGLPDLAAFRATIPVKGRSLSATVIAMREKARY